MGGREGKREEGRRAGRAAGNTAGVSCAQRLRGNDDEAETGRGMTSAAIDKIVRSHSLLSVMLGVACTCVTSSSVVALCDIFRADLATHIV